MFADKEEGVHLATYLVGIAGLLLHAAVDGAVLLSGDAGRGDALAWAVVLHRLPAGLAVWWLARIGFGVRIAWLVLGLLALATIGGYEMAAKMLDLVSNDIFAWFQAFVAGSLLHLAFHRVRFGGHDHNHSHRH
jgi:zinc transporter ZupT